MGAHGQLESAWPVYGSLLVLKSPTDSAAAVAYCVAGRSAHLDGGLNLCRLDAITGRLLAEIVIDSRDPATGRDWLSGKHMFRAPVTLRSWLWCLTSHDLPPFFVFESAYRGPCPDPHASPPFLPRFPGTQPSLRPMRRKAVKDPGCDKSGQKIVDCRDNVAGCPIHSSLLT